MRVAQEMNVAREQRVPEHWGRLSTIALKNRQADTDLALQREYQRRLATKNNMIANLKKREQAMQDAQRAHMDTVAAYEARERAKKEEKAERKRRFLAGEQVQAYNRNTYSSGGSQSAKRSVGSSSGAKSGTVRKNVKSNAPKRLFNSYD